LNVFRFGLCRNFSAILKWESASDALQRVLQSGFSQYRIEIPRIVEIRWKSCDFSGLTAGAADA
jgi:hypothetical protein